MSRISEHNARERDNLCRRLRAFLQARNFVEIHTPILLRSPSGSPYQDPELRTCMELKLRSALAEGLSAVFELGPCFRREDAPGRIHHPEFYLLELFQKELSYERLLELTRDLLGVAANVADLQFDVIDVGAWLREVLDVEVRSPDIRRQLLSRGLAPASFETRPTFEAVNHVLRERLEAGKGTRTRPALLHRYPVSTVCLAQRERDCPEVISRFEVFVDGIEVAHGFVDEMDPDDLLVRMRENGPQFVDWQFVELVRSGRLPPSAGVGFGIERLLVAFLGAASVSSVLHENQFDPEPK